MIHLEAFTLDRWSPLPFGLKRYGTHLPMDECALLPAQRAGREVVRDRIMYDHIYCGKRVPEPATLEFDGTLYTKTDRCNSRGEHYYRRKDEQRRN